MRCQPPAFQCRWAALWLHSSPFQRLVGTLLDRQTPQRASGVRKLVPTLPGLGSHWDTVYLSSSHPPVLQILQATLVRTPLRFRSMIEMSGPVSCEQFTAVSKAQLSYIRYGLIIRSSHSLHKVTIVRSEPWHQKIRLITLSGW